MCLQWVGIAWKILCCKGVRNENTSSKNVYDIISPIENDNKTREILPLQNLNHNISLHSQFNNSFQNNNYNELSCGGEPKNYPITNSSETSLNERTEFDSCDIVTNCKNCGNSYRKSEYCKQCAEGCSSWQTPYCEDENAFYRPNARNSQSSKLQQTHVHKGDHYKPYSKHDDFSAPKEDAGHLGPKGDWPDYENIEKSYSFSEGQSQEAHNATYYGSELRESDEESSNESVNFEGLIQIVQDKPTIQQPYLDNLHLRNKQIGQPLLLSTPFRREVRKSAWINYKNTGETSEDEIEVTKVYSNIITRCPITNECVGITQICKILDVSKRPQVISPGGTIPMAPIFVTPYKYSLQITDLEDSY